MKRWKRYLLITGIVILCCWGVFELFMLYRVGVAKSRLESLHAGMSVREVLPTLGLSHCWDFCSGDGARDNYRSSYHLFCGHHVLVVSSNMTVISVSVDGKIWKSQQ